MQDRILTRRRAKGWREFEMKRPYRYPTAKLILDSYIYSHFAYSRFKSPILWGSSLR